MKIALVSPYDFAHPGGVVNHILALDKQFCQMGHDVRIIAPASEASVSPQVDGRFIQIGKPRSVPMSGSIARISLSLRLSKDIKAALAREKFDIIHLHEPFIPMLCTATLRFSDTITVGTFHAFGGRPGYYISWPLFYYLMRRRNRKLSGHIAVSKPAYEYARKHVPGKYTIIPNGIDLEHFNPQVPPIERFKDGKINILFVGRMERRKGLDYLLKAFEIIRKKNDNVRLIVVGPGKVLRRSYERTVRKRGIEDVAFVGRVTYDELPRYYQTADIYCSPATGRESFGIVLLEAMALGKPMVATNIEGYRHVVTDGQEGILVPPKNARILSEALEKLIDEEATRQEMGQHGIATAARYDWKIVANRVLQFYQDTITRCRS
ncbi:MAG: glycosyltransferase family 4 protein [Dehalococcoidales bacterium]|jgi:phosphatidylinositol alpha-mannosyltransferase|nr:glycosyltransferase family 4 protein [Dehalococcoidales bacterium]MDD5604817.1 glycosyltransferase family 4 protein [Dehalococcoidales bacterium]MDX9985950.1 glycosyltransferase family 4 protein [Dehalococcoidales bacterium]NLE89463.1 glycosyltransferase family 4 protein [Dehalococcoidales bacterium]